jgi:hypothetical protein
MEQLRGLLLTLIQLAENEVLRDEGEAYARELDDAGADVTNVRYNGTIHDFALLNALLDVPSTGTALRQAATDLATTSADVMARLALDQPSDYRGHDRTDPNRASRGDNDSVTRAVGPTSLVLT